MIHVSYCKNTGEYTNIPSCRWKLVFDSSRLQEEIFVYTLVKLYNKVNLMFIFRMFQQFAGLPDTGQLNRKTVAKMKERRCGVPDIVDNLDPNKPMEYTLNGKPW